MNLADRIKSSLTAELLTLIRVVKTEAESLDLPLFIVGGSVRDILLGRRLNDFDLTTEGNAIALARSLASKHGGKVTVHAKFGTAKWSLPDNLKTDQHALDLISARSEIYKFPAALPTVKLGSIEDDLSRRDFTINALAIRLDGAHFGELLDDLNGMEDLQKGIIRVLHPRSFIEDPTRMYRAVRYEKRYRFKIAENTLALVPEARSLIEKLSAQRIRHELDLILAEPNTVSMLTRLDEFDLLAPIHPALSRFNQSNLATLKPGDQAMQDRQSRWILWLMHLTGEEIESVNKRLHFTADLLKTLRSASLLTSNQTAVVGLRPSQCVEMLENYSLRALEAVYQVLPEEEIRNKISKYLLEWRYVEPRTTGHDLKKRGIPPGPRYAEILRRLRAAWLDGEVRTAEEELIMLDELIRNR
jgi:tRNA nucleotidyltransferase (CCA-adding enzyme)